MKKLIALLLVMTMVLAFAACGKKEAPVTEAPTETTVPPTTAAPDPIETDVTVMSHADFVAADVDSFVTVETYVQATESWWDNAVKIYAQSEDGGYFIYNAECSQEDAAKLVPGTKIRVSGVKGEWSGMVEIMDGTFEIMEGSYISGATDVTDLLESPSLIDHQNEKVSFSGLTIEPSNEAGDAFLYGWDGSGQPGSDSDLYFKASVGGKTYTFVVEYYLCNENSDCYKAVTNLKVGDVVRMEGFLYWYEGAQPHVTSVTTASTATNGQ